jgi:hypothetical protein
MAPNLRGGTPAVKPHAATSRAEDQGVRVTATRA